MQTQRPVELTTAKGLPAATDLDLAAAASVGWSVFDGTALLPLVVLNERAVRHNVDTMAAYCERHGVSLAPHGKTTMAPALFDLQLAAGAWGITAATVWQARVMKAAGVPRVLIANEVVAEADVRWLAEALEDPDFDVCCYVDSRAGVEILERVLTDVSGDRPLPVLVEYGVPGGRTGARTIDEALDVARSVSASSRLELRGTSAFEGIITATAGGSADALVVDFLAELAELTVAIGAAGGFDAVSEVVVSAGGSAYFDHVVDVLGRIELDRPVRVVLRSGCYVTHSDGGYEHSSPMGSAPRVPIADGRLEAAMEVWGVVLSRPSRTQAIVGIGKRDVSPDGDPPVLRRLRRPDGNPVTGSARVVAMNDQHAYLEVDADCSLAVGDLASLGVGHPCTTFDKWRAIPMVDDDFVVRRIVRTYF